MDNSLAYLVLAITGGLLSLVVTLLITYAIIRVAVLHALKAHTRWVRDGSP